MGRVTTLKKLSVLGLALLVLALAAPAPAGPPGQWTQMNSLQVGATSEFGVARTSDGSLHAIWVEDDDQNWNLMHRTIGFDGTVGDPQPVITGWGFMDPVPDLLTTTSGSLQAFVGGSPPNTAGGLWTVSSTDGGSNWSTPTLVNDRTFWGGSTSDVQAYDGTFFQATGGLVHRGLNRSARDYDFGEQYGCCIYDAKLAKDVMSGEVWLALFLQKGPTEEPSSGVYLQQVNLSSGAPLGSPVVMPGSTSDFEGGRYSSNPGGRLPLVGRIGGGMYTAFNGGYPGVDKVLVWKVGDAASVTVANVPAGLEDSAIELAPGPDGRMWLLWGIESTPTKIYASISNDTVTSWSPPAQIRLPFQDEGFGDIYSIQAEATTDHLDILTMIGSVDVSGLFHTQIPVPGEWTDGNDVITGTGAPDTVFGGPGNDKLSGLGGADRLSGGTGNDKLNGGPGKDVMNGGPGQDICTLTKGDRARGCEKKKRNF